MDSGHLTVNEDAFANGLEPGDLRLGCSKLVTMSVHKREWREVGQQCLSMAAGLRGTVFNECICGGNSAELV